jgi:hypothetical protein
MRRILLPAALVLALSGSLAFAQQPQTAPAATDAQAPMAAPHHAPNPQHEVKHLAKALNLTPDQVAKLEPILADRDQKLEAIRSNGQLTQEDEGAAQEHGAADRVGPDARPDPADEVDASRARPRRAKPGATTARRAGSSFCLSRFCNMTKAFAIPARAFVVPTLNPGVLDAAG